MTDDQPKDPARPRTAALDDELSAAERSAADDPTAMWDDAALRDAGMDDLVERARKSLPPSPATGPDVKGDSRDSVVIAQKRGAASPSAQQGAPRPRPAASGGLSWPVTIGLAMVLGLVVYVLVRLIR